MIQAILPNLREELLVALLPPQEADEQDARPVEREEGAYRIELAREDLENYQGKGELPESGADVSTLKRSLRSPNLDQFLCAIAISAGLKSTVSDEVPLPLS